MAIPSSGGGKAAYTEYREVRDAIDSFRTGTLGISAYTW